MRQLLRCEYQKSRGRWILCTALALTALAAAVALRGDYNGENRQFILENGYLMLLYQLPMVNTIFSRCWGWWWPPGFATWSTRGTT